MITSETDLLLSAPRFTAAASLIRDDIIVMPVVAQVAEQLVSWMSAEREG